MLNQILASAGEKRVQWQSENRVWPMLGLPLHALGVLCDLLFDFPFFFVTFVSFCSISHLRRTSVFARQTRSSSSAAVRAGSG